ncbi:N-terminal asparagine amidohydrolase-like protein [Sporormia fimetaria CBS 119925]|uniref:N-terminal asparagine amidohydrolase-like protein n=1 Tax=Sporormia fimetaria CBS 119925 TaxID=1340428 RepID=A0A6A6VMR5_9PLEO|nr:N-terminal asparagine amidohydrolase-like protein [Sporormia fimetaria CBS 119925]
MGPRIACLQLAPRLGKVEDNMARADLIIEDTFSKQSSVKTLDWLILPEMAFTGYHFDSLDEIKPFLEPTTSGPTTQWAIKTAQALNCNVTVGYPELSTDPAHQTQFNSTVTVSRTGEILANYRKHFLYYTDETWASEGPSRFFSGPLGDLGPVTHGICMDINPHKFTAPWDAYEFANVAVDTQTPTICLSMAWLCMLSPEELLMDPSTPDIATMQYWIERFLPIIKERGHRTIHIILANRSGIEKTSCYAGSTTILKVVDGVVSSYGWLGKAVEKCLVADLNEEPRYTLVKPQ